MKLPKLHLRDLFWLVLVAAMGLCWWLEYRHRSEWMQDVKRFNPMLYNIRTGEQIQTNRLKPRQPQSVFDAIERWIEEDGYLVDVDQNEVTVISPEGQRRSLKFTP